MKGFRSRCWPGALLLPLRGGCAAQLRKNGPPMAMRLWAKARFSLLDQITPANRRQPEAGLDLSHEAAGLPAGALRHRRTPPAGCGRGDVCRHALWPGGGAGRRKPGKQLWAYQVPGGDNPATRGVAYWPGKRPQIAVRDTGGLPDRALCRHTGAPVRGFGTNGVVSLRSEAVLQGFPTPSWA